MAAAQRLATATSIDLAVARSHSACVPRPRSPPSAPSPSVIPAPGLRTYVQLFAGSPRPTTCAAMWPRTPRSSTPTDFAEDIDTSHALYASLVVQMVRSCDAYLATGAHRPTPTITARLNFQLAFGTRVGQRLAEAREEAKQEATRDRRTAPGDRTRVAQQGSRAA